jgi:hypothetical protein
MARFTYNCATCGREFSQRWKVRTEKAACSKVCKRSLNYGTANCERCGKPFEFKRCEEQRRGRPRFCSHTCYAPRWTHKPCVVCGKPLERPSGQEVVACFGSCQRQLRTRASNVRRSAEARGKRKRWRESHPCVCGKPRAYQKATCGSAECIAVKSGPRDQTPWTPHIGHAWSRFNSRQWRRDLFAAQPWKRKCHAAAMTVSKRREAGVGTCRPRRQPGGDWMEGIAIAVSRLIARNARRERNADPWRAKAESTASNLRKRRRLRDARNGEGHTRAVVRTPRTPAVQVCFDWQTTES